MSKLTENDYVILSQFQVMPKPRQVREEEVKKVGEELKKLDFLEVLQTMMNKKPPR